MIEVMQRRNELREKIAAQRGQLAEVASRWQPALTLADQGLAGMRFMRSHPVLVGGAVALLVIRRRGMLGLLMGGWRAWKGYRSLIAFSAKLQSRPQPKED